MDNQNESEFDVAFDCDGTLTDAAVTTTGQDNGQQWDVTPILLAQRLGCTVAVQTCNVIDYVGAELEARGIAVYLDHDMEHKTPPEWLKGRVLVTNRKVLARIYPDDRGMEFHYGDGPAVLLRRLGFGPTDAEIHELVNMVGDGGNDESYFAVELVIDAIHLKNGMVEFDPNAPGYNAYLIGC